MKLKKIRNALLVVLTLALVSAASVAITFALTDTMNTITNELTSKSIAVELSEQKWDGTPGTGETNLNLSNEALGQTKANGYQLNTAIPKNPSLYNASTAEPEYVALVAIYKVDYKKAGDSTRTTAYLTQAQFERSFAHLYSDETGTTAGLTSNWTHRSGTVTTTIGSHPVDVYYYNNILAVEERTDEIFKSVKVDGLTAAATSGHYTILDPTQTNGTDRIELADLPSFDIILKGYAVQSNDMDGEANGAHTALDDLIKADAHVLFS